MEELLNEDTTLKYRGNYDLGLYGINIVQFIQNNINDIKIGIYHIVGTNQNSILTDWGRLLIFSKYSAIYVGLNSKDLLILTMNSSRWHYTILKGDSFDGPF